MRWLVRDFSTSVEMTLVRDVSVLLDMTKVWILILVVLIKLKYCAIYVVFLDFCSLY